MDTADPSDTPDPAVNQPRSGPPALTAKHVGARRGASVAGAGGGTLLVLLAQNMSAQNPWKSWLMIIAPSSSVFLAEVWQWLRGPLITSWARMRRRKQI